MKFVSKNEDFLVGYPSELCQVIKRWSLTSKQAI